MTLHKKIVHGFVVRHGSYDTVPEDKTPWAELGVLNDTGRAQMARVAEALAGEKIVRIIHSPLVRAKESAEAIRQGLEFSGPLIMAQQLMLLNAANAVKLFDRANDLHDGSATLAQVCLLDEALMRQEGRRLYEFVERQLWNMSDGQSAVFVTHEPLISLGAAHGHKLWPPEPEPTVDRKTEILGKGDMMRFSMSFLGDDLKEIVTKHILLTHA